jgi:hypothetical protein
MSCNSPGKEVEGPQFHKSPWQETHITPNKNAMPSLQRHSRIYLERERQKIETTPQDPRPLFPAYSSGRLAMYAQVNRYNATNVDKQLAKTLLTYNVLTVSMWGVINSLYGDDPLPVGTATASSHDRGAC